MQQIKENVLNILAQFGIEPDYISSMDITLSELRISSMDMIHIAIAIYDEFGIKLKLSKKHDLSLSELCTAIADRNKKGTNEVL